MVLELGYQVSNFLNVVLVDKLTVVSSWHYPETMGSISFSIHSCSSSWAFCRKVLLSFTNLFGLSLLVIKCSFKSMWEARSGSLWTCLLNILAIVLAFEGVFFFTVKIYLLPYWRNWDCYRNSVAYISFIKEHWYKKV